MATVSKKRKARKQRVSKVGLLNTTECVRRVAEKLKEQAGLLPDRGRMIDGARMPERALSLLNRFLGKLAAENLAE